MRARRGPGSTRRTTPMEMDVELRAWQECPLWEPGPGTFPVKYGRAVIQRILPHRPPFLFVDAITRIDVAQGCLRGQRQLRGVGGQSLRPVVPRLVLPEEPVTCAPRGGPWRFRLGHRGSRQP